MVCIINHFLLRTMEFSTQQTHQRILRRRIPSHLLPFSHVFVLNLTLFGGNQDITQGKPNCFRGISIFLTRFIFCSCKVILMFLFLRLVPSRLLYLINYFFMFSKTFLQLKCYNFSISWLPILGCKIISIEDCFVGFFHPFCLVHVLYVPVQYLSHFGTWPCSKSSLLWLSRITEWL